MQKSSRAIVISVVLSLVLWMVFYESPVVSAAQTFISPTPPSGAVPVTCTGSTADAAIIQAAMNSNPGVILSGTCNLGATTLTFGSNFFLGGTGKLNYTGTGWAVASSGNYNIVTGLTFNGGGLNLSLNDTTNYTGQYGWTIEGNTFKNISNGNQAAVYVTNIIGKGPSETARDTTSISYNTFYNIWGPRAYPDLNTDAWGGAAGCGTDCMVGSSGIFITFGWDNVKVDYNNFDIIGGNAIKGGNDHLLGYIDPYMGQNIDVSHNVMARVHRMGIEVQGSMSGACPGGCNYRAHYMEGVTANANYFHAPALAMDTFAFSLMFGATNVQILNNSAVDEDPNNVWPLGIGLENGFSGGLLQGNVISSVYVMNAGGYNNGHSWAGGPIDTGYTMAGYTNMFYNNYGCGDGYASPSLIGYDPEANGIVDEKAEYVASSCPADIATSNIVAAFTGSTDPTPTATSWTFQLGVASALSIAQVQFFMDGAATPIAIQEIQDLNPNFPTTAQWFYHVTVDLSKLSGSHTLVATATDVSDGTQSATLSFNVPGTGTRAAPTAPVVTAAPGDSQITLSWTPVVDATYSVYRSVSPGAEGSMPIVSGVIGTTYTDTYLTNGDTYYYRVSAVIPGTGMAASAEISAAPNGPPVEPLVLDAPIVSNGTVTLEWNSVAENATYSVCRGTKPGGEALSPIVSGLTSPTYTDTTVVNGMTYYYTVSANIRFSVASGKSNEVSASPRGIGGPLSMSLAVSAGNGQATLTWNNVLAGATYSIYRGTSPEGEGATPIMAVYGVTGYLDTGLTDGVTYYYTVSTVVPGVGGGFANSTEVSAIPAAPVAGNGGVLTGSLNTTSTTYSLTALGTSDWASWGLWNAGGAWGGSIPSFDHKTTGWSQISDAGLAGSSESNIGYWDDSTIPIQVSWTDGTPISTPVNAGGLSYGYYYATGGVAGSGFFFTVPADTTPRTLMFIAGACSNGVTDVVAHLSDNSAPDYTDSSLADTTGHCPSKMGMYTLTYSAASAGQTLTVYITADQNRPGETWLSAAALRGGTPQVTATIHVANKQYDGTTAATITGCTLNGVSVGADVQCDYSSVIARFSDGNVGTGKAVVVTGFATLTGTEAAGYSLTSTLGGSADITAIPVQLQLASTHLVYPGATNVTACIPSDGAASGASGSIQIYDGTTLLTTQPVQGGGCAYWYISPGLSAGSHQLGAVYSGDKNNPPSSAVPVSVQVDPVPVNLSAACWNASFNYGANYQCTVNASSNSGSAPGDVTYSYDGGAAVAVPLNNGNAQFTILLPAVGIHSVVISYARQGNYSAALAPAESFTVTPAPVSVVLTPSSWSAKAGTTLIFQAAVTSYSAGAPQSNGAVSFSDGSAPLITVPVDGGGQARFATSNLSVGSHVISASYSSGTNYATGSSRVTITVAP